MDKVFRVAVISTGGVGSIAVPAVVRRSDFDLVGVWVHRPDKVGVDAGVLVGMDPIGLHMMFDVMGFGKPMNYTPILAFDGVQQFAWGPPIRLVAHALGITLDEIAESEITPRELTVAAGVIPAGTCGAIRTETMGMVDGKPVITIEHVNRMAPDIAPQWPTAPNGTYRILIDGEPSMTCDLRLGTPVVA